MSARSVLLAGGGSAGHVSPLLATADALRRRDPEVRVSALGTSTGLEARLVPERGYELLTVPKVAFPRRLSPRALRLPGDLAAAVRAADAAIVRSGATVVVGFGGYVSTPAYLAAKRRGIPIVIHEGNARPGLANRLGARLTRHVATTFESTRLPHARCIGMPMRTEITRLDRAALRGQAREHYGFDDGRPVLLVTGGSLGAQRLNDAFSGAVADLRAAGIQVLHLAGGGKGFTPEAPDRPEAPPYVVAEYADRMELAYAAADLVVCRAGANTVCELAALGLPAIYVPLPIGNGEQRVNAEPLVAAGGGTLVDDAEVDPQWVRRFVIPLLGHTERVEAMARAAARAGRRDADEALARIIETAGTERAATRRKS